MLEFDRFLVDKMKKRLEFPLKILGRQRQKSILGAAILLCLKDLFIYKSCVAPSLFREFPYHLRVS